MKYNTLGAKSVDLGEISSCIDSDRMALEFIMSGWSELNNVTSNFSRNQNNANPMDVALQASYNFCTGYEAIQLIADDLLNLSERLDQIYLERLNEGETDE